MSDDEMLMDEMLERRMEAQETLKDNLMNEFDMSYTDKDILEDMFKFMSKQEIIDYCLLDIGDLTSGSEFEEYKESLFDDYCEHRN